MRGRPESQRTRTKAAALKTKPQALCEERRHFLQLPGIPDAVKHSSSHDSEDSDLAEMLGRPADRIEFMVFP